MEIYIQYSSILLFELIFDDGSGEHIINECNTIYIQIKNNIKQGLSHAS